MNRTTSILIVLICAALFGAGALWYINSSNQIKPNASNPIADSSSINTGGVGKDMGINIEKILNEVPFREIGTTKQEYEALGWNRYENKEIGFEIYYPGDWKVSESKARDTSDEPPYMSISFAPKTLFVDFTFALYVFKEPLKDRLLTIAERGWLPVEKLHINNTGAVIIGRYSKEDNRAYRNVTFGPDDWTIDFVSESNNPSVYERMFKSFRLLDEK